MTSLPELIDVESSHIKQIGYDEEKEQLFIKFKQDKIYQYFNFPLDMWERFLEEESKGKFLSYYIKGKYEFMGLEDYDRPFEVGARVYHEKYNTGTITKILEDGKIVVEFDNNKKVKTTKKKLVIIRS